MKVLFVQPWGERLGGSENMLWTLLRHLDRHRVEPVVAFLQPGPFEREVAGLGIMTAIAPARRFRRALSTVRTARVLSELVETLRPDLLVNWMAKAQLYGGLAALIARRADRVMWWQHEVSSGAWIDRVATLLPARAVGCSSQAAATAQGRLRPRRPTLVVHPGIERPSSMPPVGIRRLRASLGIPPRRMIVGTVARLQPSKGQARLIRSVAELRRRGDDLHCLIVGGNAHGLFPHYETSLRRLAAELGITDAITFTGQVADGRPYIQLMDIFVSTSDAEPFGIVLLEAMALCVPVLAFAAAGPLEIVEPEVSGLLVSPHDERALADAIERLAIDRALRDRLAEAGRRRYDERFTAARMVGEIERDFEAVLAG